MDNIGNNIINYSENIKKNYNDYQKYTLNHQLIVIAIGVCIGIATKDVITNIMNQIILPIIKSFGEHTLYNIIYKLLLVNTKHITILNSSIQYMGIFIWNLLSWSIIVFIAYLFMTQLIKLDIITPHINLIEDGARLFLLKS